MFRIYVNICRLIGIRVWGLGFGAVWGLGFFPSHLARLWGLGFCIGSVVHIELWGSASEPLAAPGA